MMRSTKGEIEVFQGWVRHTLDVYGKCIGVRCVLDAYWTRVRWSLRVVP